MHGIEHIRQGGTGYRIKFTWYKIGILPIPSMYILFEGEHKNRSMVLLAGGLYTSVLLFVTAFLFYFSIIMHTSETQGKWIADYEILYALLLNGVVQWFYGYYEMIFLDKVEHKSYMLGHYVVYVVVITVFTVGWFTL